MATQTPNLGLILPAYGEFQNSWNIPVNTNWNIIDTAVGASTLEIVTARGSTASLNTRLSVALDSLGNLISPPEIVAARSTSIYGNVDPVTAAPFLLHDQLEQSDREISLARNGQATLSAGLAALNTDEVSDSVISAPNNFITFTGAVVTVHGDVTNVVANINGYRQVVRTQLNATIAGGAGTYYLYLQRNPLGTLYLDRSGVGQNTGQVAVNLLNTFLQQFTDSTQNFVTSGVQPGDILVITSVGSQNANRYVVASVVDPNNLLIIGLFVTAQSGLNYTISAPIAPSLNFTATPHAKRFVSVPNQIYIGRCVFDGTNVTSVSIYALKGLFEQFFSITLGGGNFVQAVLHNLGYFPTDIQFFGAQVNDYSQPMDPLSTEGATGSTRSVIANTDDLQILTKNAVNGLFYTDYGGTAWTSGFLLVRAQR